MRAVNLLPRDEVRQSSGGTRLPFIVAAGGVAAITVAVVSLSLSASGTAADLRVELAAVEAAVQLVPREPSQPVGTASLAQERTDRLAALTAAMSTRIPFDRLLREISLVLPEDTWLTAIAASAPEGASPAGGTAPRPTAPAAIDRSVTIQGATFSHESVARVLARLSAVPSLKSVQLTASTRLEPVATQPANGSAGAPKSAKKKPPKAKPVVTFTILASVGPGSAS